MSKNFIKEKQQHSTYDYLFKSIIVGDSAVGKTNIVLRFTEDEYKATHTATIGVDFKVKILDVHGAKIKLQIWDTAGQCKFRNVTKTYFKGAIAALFVFSVTDRKSFDNIGDWVRQANDNSDSTPIRILMGNKCDLGKEHRTVTQEQGKMLAQKYNMEYFDVSAKDGTNINNVFMRIGQLMKQIGEKQYSNVRPSGVEIQKKQEPHKQCCK